MRKVYERRAKVDFAIDNSVITKGELIYVSDSYRVKDYSYVDIYNYKKVFLDRINLIHYKLSDYLEDEKI